MSTHETSESYSDAEVKEDVEESEEEYENAGGLSSRLSGLTRPKIAPAPKRQRLLYQKTAATRVKAKGKGKGRNQGKLAQLMEMPLDVLFEITSQLEPLDILQLSRVSKHFRTIFASKSSRHIWVASRKNVPGMSDCPHDLSEPQYASLMFEHNCQACGKSRSHMADYSLRVNFCTPCFKANVKKGSVALRPYGGIPDIVLTLLPRSLLKNRYDYIFQPFDRGSFEARNNSRQNMFYLPEVEMVVKRYQVLQSDPTALKRFIDQQQTIASGIMNHAITLDKWKDSSKRQKRDDGEERSQNRRACIETKLLEMGWDRKYFPARWNTQWTALVDQPRELTPRIWKVIRPKLEALLEESKAVELHRARQDRLEERKDEFLSIWTEFVEGTPDTQDRWLMPNFEDACDLPTIEDMLMDDDVQIPVTKEIFLAKLDSILSDVAHFQKTVKRDLVKLLMPNKYVSDTSNPIAGDVDGDVDFTILDDASSLFSCPTWRCNKLIGFPAIFAHEHVQKVESHWHVVQHAMKPDSTVGPTVSEVLKIFGIPKGTHVAALEELNGRCVCLCGHPEFRAPMDFGSLIHHLVEENSWYSRRVEGLRPDATKFILHNDHDLTSSKPCVALLSANELANRSADTDVSPAKTQTKYCKICLILTTIHTPLTYDDEIAFHMKSKHLKEVEKGDTLTFLQLYDWMRDEEI